MIPVSDEVVENAKKCLEILNDDFTLNFRVYNSYDEGRVPEENVCGTSFCIAGWQAFKEGYPEEYRDEYPAFSNPWFDHYSFTLSKVDDNTTA